MHLCPFLIVFVSVDKNTKTGRPSQPVFRIIRAGNRYTISSASPNQCRGGLLNGILASSKIFSTVLQTKMSPSASDAAFKIYETPSRSPT